jgi:hypothetical protein
MRQKHLCIFMERSTFAFKLQDDLVAYDLACTGPTASTSQSLSSFCLVEPKRQLLGSSEYPSSKANPHRLYLGMPNNG